MLNNRVMVLHGGLFKEDGVKLDDIRAVDRFREPPDSGNRRSQDKGDGKSQADTHAHHRHGLGAYDADADGEHHTLIDDTGQVQLGLQGRVLGRLGISRPCLPVPFSFLLLGRVFLLLALLPFLNHHVRVHPAALPTVVLGERVFVVVGVYVLFYIKDVEIESR